MAVYIYFYGKWWCLLLASVLGEQYWERRGEKIDRVRYWNVKGSEK